jgi:hypothetical protein
MKIRVLPLVSILTLAVFGQASAGEIIATSCLFKATHEAGSSYHLDALYSGSIDANKWEEAAASTPIHPGGERWCHWKIQTRITRKILVVYKGGVERALDTTPPTEVWYSATIYGQGRPRQDCELSASRFQSDYVHAVGGLTSDFGEVVDGDSLNAQRVIRAKYPNMHVELEQ